MFHHFRLEEVNVSENKFQSVHARNEVPKKCNTSFKCSFSLLLFSIPTKTWQMLQTWAKPNAFLSCSIWRQQKRNLRVVRQHPRHKNARVESGMHLSLEIYHVEITSTFRTLLEWACMTVRWVFVHYGVRRPMYNAFLFKLEFLGEPEVRKCIASCPKTLSKRYGIKYTRLIPLLALATCTYQDEPMVA